MVGVCMVGGMHDRVYMVGGVPGGGGSCMTGETATVVDSAGNILTLQVVQTILTNATVSKIF